MHQPSPVRLIIADDHALFREGVRRFLDTEADFRVVGEAADGEAAVTQCRLLQPDVLLLDVSMPRLSGIEALDRLRQAAPRTAVVLLTARVERRELLEGIMLGIRGLILKTADTDTLAMCVRRVASGGYWIENDSLVDLVEALRSPQSPAPPPRPVSFTPRESQIVRAVTEGASNADISRTFGLSGQTVKNHLTRIFDKVGVSTRVELALYVIAHGTVDASSGTPFFS